MAFGSSSTGRTESAFHEISDPLPSPSTILEKCSYDVFINHHGKDVKMNLASPIYHFLGGIGIQVFLDQKELDLGDLFPKVIEDVMRSAQIHIAIFSRNYATSPWCLEELSFMLKISAIRNYATSPWCLEELSFMLKISATIIPVFYDVQPTDLRWVDSKEMYAQAFQDYEAKGRYLPETLKKWKEALHDVSYINGDILNSNGDLGLLLKKIAKRIQQEIKNVKVPFQVARYPVGLDDAVKGFDDTIGRSAQGHQNVQIVVIVGMSGSGKTTLARELYNRKHKAFDRCSFLSEVREAKLTGLQKELLKDLAHLENVPYKDASQLKSFLAGRFKKLSGPVLIVLDDVDDFNQLDNLLPDEGRSLGSGSLIIVTTPNMDILRWTGISSVYKMKTMDPHHAEELFCRHAFLQPSPPDCFKGLVQKFINACDGLPLSIEVIAEMLYKKPENEWISNLEKMSRLLPGKITKRLRLAYDALDIEEKAIFLDVACFFVGEKENLAMAVWDATSWRGFGTLVNKCLVEIDKQNRIRMHNHLRDLGREIAIECPPHRLWSPLQNAVIKRSMRSIQESMLSVRGVMAATTQFVACSAHKELPKCCYRYPLPFEEWMDLRSLELLVVTGEYFSSSVFAKLSMDLVWLRLFDFQDTDLPSWLSLRNLRVLELYGASRLQELWENKLPKELREMIITATEGNIFHRFPSVASGLEHLKKIALISEHEEGFCFASLPDELCYLQSLEHLELRRCKLLQSLPERFGMLKKLRHLDLHSCEMLRKLPESFKQLKDLEYLDLSGCRKLIPMPDIFENIENLKNLYFSGCSPKWRHLPLHITYQKSLRELHLQNTRLNDVPDNISKLSKLETLTIGSPNLRVLPTSLGDLPSLANLEIAGCNKLEVLPPVEGLNLLESLCLEDSEVKSLPRGFGQLTNLLTLKIFDCPIGELDFSSASSSSLEKLKVMHFKGTKVTRISICQGGCPSLETLQVEQNYDLTDLEIRSTSVKIVKVYECRMLQTLKIFYCPIGELVFSLASCSLLEKLKVMHLKGTKATRISICKDCCPSLETLQLEENDDLMEMEILSTSVKIVKVYECTKLRIIKGIPDLVRLETLEITGCQKLEQGTVAAARKWEFLMSLQSLTQRLSSLRI